jgi:hypothetical protein
MFIFFFYFFFFFFFLNKGFRKSKLGEQNREINVTHTSTITLFRALFDVTVKITIKF